MLLQCQNDAVSNDSGQDHVLKRSDTVTVKETIQTNCIWQIMENIDFKCIQRQQNAILYIVLFQKLFTYMGGSVRSTIALHLYGCEFQSHLRNGCGILPMKICSGFCYILLVSGYFSITYGVCMFAPGDQEQLRRLRTMLHVQEKNKLISSECVKMAASIAEDLIQGQREPVAHLRNTGKRNARQHSSQPQVTCSHSSGH